MANQPKKYKKFVATAATATLVASAIVPVASAASLSDIKGNTHEEAITSLVDAGVINGYPDGTFQPNKTLTRSDVVKLLGKYLVSKGLEVPADYKTNVRFNDLTSASNDELLKYAAVVYDAGVFSGSNGNLLAGDNITRENMAVVLVRAFDTLNNIDLVSYVQGEEYKKDVKDLYTAKAEARAAIEVLDFFDITNPSVANFNPKGSTTRGQFATFLYKTINTDFSAVTGVANSAVSEIKAINNTTVEVTFKETVDNIESLDFTIEGLDVKNAVVKQTDAKTVVVTTAAQTGDKVYTLNVNAAKAGTFKGISAVIPTAVNVTTGSVQGIIGKEVTVKAEVTVPTGQSKAGIPVTFNITSNSANTDKIEVQSVTNADGVATYTYTRYYASEDT
ncbi:MAG: S-layer homology domain-containing protein, partial [Solibacillus sp.]